MKKTDMTKSEPITETPTAAEPVTAVAVTTGAPPAEATAAIVRQEDRRPMDLLGGLQLLSVADQKVILTEYAERRTHFRQWLMSQLKEGVHYGFPPGCEVKYDNHGNVVQYIKGNMQILNPKQWVAKPSLYKAGALFIIEVLRLRDMYFSDLDAWKMMGGKAGQLVRTCRLINPANGEVLGEGTGSFDVGGKGMDANGAVKMADKRAVVAAVINTIALCADLFTQDIEDKPPASKPGAPKGEEGQKQDKDFAAMVQNWFEENIEPDNPVAGHKLTPQEIKGLRGQIAIWCKGHVPQSAEEALQWITGNVRIAVREDTEGTLVGVRFERIDPDDAV